MSAATKTHVLIVGAGLGGLGLAQGLKKHGIGFSLFERDPSADTRSQGYRIKIFPDTVPDLQQLIPSELFAEFEATSAETVMVETCVNAVDGRLLSRRALRGHKPYTVDRSFLRKVLLHGLEDHICWGKDVTHYEVDNKSPNPVRIFFSDGGHASGTFLVGADGGRSRMRRQVLQHASERHNIIDPEAVCIYGRTPLSQALEERIQKHLLRGLVIARDVAPPIQQIIFDSELPVSMFVERMHFPGRDISLKPKEHGLGVHVVQDLPEDYMYWAMLAPSKLIGFTEEMVASTFASKTPRELALLLTEEWDDSTRCLVELQDETYAAALRIISTTPDSFVENPEDSHSEQDTYEPLGLVTLIGDSIHVMSPSGGVGAATALKDAVLLTKALAAVEVESSRDGGGISLRESVQNYEAAMRRNAKVAIERSFRGGKVIYGQPPLEKCRVLTDV